MKRLTKDSYNKVLDGVCSGIANYLEIDTTIVRLIYIILGLIFPISMLFFYFIAMLIIPKN